MAWFRRHAHPRRRWSVGRHPLHRHTGGHVVSGYREALLAGREDDTVITRAYTGKTLRAMRNDYTQHFEEHPDELRPPDQMVVRPPTVRCTSAPT